MAQPAVWYPSGRRLIPRCPAVQFLVRQKYSPARYLAVRGSVRMAAFRPAGRALTRPAGRALTPVNMARTPASARVQMNRPALVLHTAATPLTVAWRKGWPERPGLQADSAPMGFPLAAGLAAAQPEVTGGQAGARDQARCASSDLMRPGPLRLELPAGASPGPRARAQAGSIRAAQARTALSQTGPVRAVVSGPRQWSEAIRPPGSSRQQRQTALLRMVASGPTAVFPRLCSRLCSRRWAVRTWAGGRQEMDGPAGCWLMIELVPGRGDRPRTGRLVALEAVPTRGPLLPGRLAWAAAAAHLGLPAEGCRLDQPGLGRAAGRRMAKAG